MYSLRPMIMFIYARARESKRQTGKERARESVGVSFRRFIVWNMSSFASFEVSAEPLSMLLTLTYLGYFENSRISSKASPTIFSRGY